MHTCSFNVTRANKQAYVTQNIVHLSNIEQKNGLILTFMRDIFYGGETTLQDTGSSVVFTKDAYGWWQPCVVLRSWALGQDGVYLTNVNLPAHTFIYFG